jgi:hypothetical protein
MGHSTVWHAQLDLRSDPPTARALLEPNVGEPRTVAAAGLLADQLAHETNLTIYTTAIAWTWR